LLVAIIAGGNDSGNQFLAAPIHQTDLSRVEILRPASTEIISGTIQIIGTAVDPAFSHYEVAWAFDPAINDQWQDIQPPVSQQVRDGVLSLWDTTPLPDGLYLLRLRLVRSDETMLETQVRVQIANATATPIPTDIPTATATLLPGPPTAGPSPTPLIQQPPTRTPRPSQTPGGPTATPTSVLLENSPFQPQRLQSAACTGVWMTLGVFLFLGVYGMIRSAIRGQLRANWWSFRRDVLNPVLQRSKRKRDQDNNSE
jgi:hypothetical protein